MCCSADWLLGFDTGIIGILAPTFWRSLLTRPAGLAEMRCTATKIVSDYMCSVGRDSSEGIATAMELMIQGSNPGGARFSTAVPTGPGIHPATL
jgi:hypothetical protein